MIGIYKITSPSNKIYIGETINIKKRWNKYKRLSCKKQPKLYNSFLKYGVLNHKFEIIELCTFNELKIKERYWQEYYKSVENGLNCLYTNTKNKKAIFSKSIRDKMSNNNTSKRIIYQYNLNGKLLNKFNSIKEASKLTNTNYASIIKVLKKERKHANNYYWLYEKDYKKFLKPINIKSDKIKSIAKMDLNNNIIKKYDSIVSAEKDGYKSRGISSVCNGRYNTHFGFKWKFIQ